MEERWVISGFARDEQAKVLIRGLRTTVDFEYEFGLTNMYRKPLPNIQINDIVELAAGE